MTDHADAAKRLLRHYFAAASQCALHNARTPRSPLSGDSITEIDDIVEHIIAACQAPIVARDALLSRLVDLDERSPTKNPEARAIVEDARVVLKRPRRDRPDYLPTTGEDD